MHTSCHWVPRDRSSRSTSQSIASQHQPPETVRGIILKFPLIMPVSISVRRSAPGLCYCDASADPPPCLYDGLGGLQVAEKEICQQRPNGCWRPLPEKNRKETRLNVCLVVQCLLGRQRLIPKFVLGPGVPQVPSRIFQAECVCVRAVRASSSYLLL